MKGGFVSFRDQVHNFALDYGVSEAKREAWIEGMVRAMASMEADFAKAIPARLKLADPKKAAAKKTLGWSDGWPTGRPCGRASRCGVNRWGVLGEETGVRPQFMEPPPVGGPNSSSSEADQGGEGGGV
ncbi:hypothetical protein CYMTET_46774 [Cymbomonas tetramitiformis]|uniref:Uncharacterized protein n=1 Tax=Cymbomonas tetramitiformis TaxID=36881 RepID=A0AAE0BWW2_9CHLO|nr:hypothetical protein CYMTET_46774 [Cymbomonas tetramitiformis]